MDKAEVDTLAGAVRPGSCTWNAFDRPTRRQTIANTFFIIIVVVVVVILFFVVVVVVVVVVDSSSCDALLTVSSVGGCVTSVMTEDQPAVRLKDEPTNYVAQFVGRWRHPPKDTEPSEGFVIVVARFVLLLCYYNFTPPLRS